MEGEYLGEKKRGLSGNDGDGVHELGRERLQRFGDANHLCVVFGLIDGITQVDQRRAVRMTTGVAHDFSDSVQPLIGCYHAGADKSNVTP